MTANIVVSDTIRSKIVILAVVAALVVPLFVLAPPANAAIEWSCNATGCCEWTAPLSTAVPSTSPRRCVPWQVSTGTCRMIFGTRPRGTPPFG